MWLAPGQPCRATLVFEAELHLCPRENASLQIGLVFSALAITTRCLCCVDSVQLSSQRNAGTSTS